MRERTIPTPLVLTVSSGMLAVALVVLAGIDESPAEPQAEPDERGAPRFTIDDRTPESVAEGFYDAWRRRQWDAALEASVADAHEAVIEKRTRDEALPRDERVVAERTWQTLANAEMRLILDEAELLDGRRHRLRGTAAYRFVGQPYQRRVQFLVVPEGARFRVAEMRLGEVLTELPPLFRGTPEASP